MTLTDFLLARIAEDEAWAMEAVFPQPWRFEASRVLAECEAKRRIVHWALTQEGEFHWGSVLQPLAAVYADHPDYREEWKP